jgi:hypothetical protein
MVEGLNRILASHSALQNDPDHLADVDVTKIWGPDPKTGKRQYVNFLGPIADIINAGASGDPQGFLARRAGYIPNIASELTSGQTLSGYKLPNVGAELRGEKYSTLAPSYPNQPQPSVGDRALSVAANQLEGLYPAGASSAQRMYERGGLSAAALSLLTGAREASERTPVGATSGRSYRPQQVQRPSRPARTP